jgi:hypothetical protein
MDSLVNRLVRDERARRMGTALAERRAHMTAADADNERALIAGSTAIAPRSGEAASVGLRYPIGCTPALIRPALVITAQPTPDEFDQNYHVVPITGNSTVGRAMGHRSRPRPASSRYVR